jgi:beta-xylosidase
MSPAPATSIPPAGAGRAEGAYPWMPDPGDGTFRNPVLHADYSDPDVIRFGDDFFLTASSFNCTPGLPILHSKDLVNWKIINHAVKNLPHPDYAEVRPGCGIWAPSLRNHAGRFWIFFPMPDEGIFVTTANHPAEPWSEPHLVQAGKGLIDPCPLWDDDGQAYLIYAYARSRSGIKDRLCVRPMAADGSRLLDEGKIVFHEPEKHPTLEGPKFLKRDGWYYILAPAGGVKTGWQVVLRARNIYGPYEDKIVLAQGSTPINGPHQGALVDTAGGNWWFLHFQDAEVYGRIIHLQPVAWQDGWPMMGSIPNGKDIGEPVLHHAKPDGPATGHPVIPQTSDEFDASTLGRQWQWHANHRDDWHSLSARKNWLRLYPQFVPHEKLAQTPNLLLQKFPARSFMVETFLEFAPEKTGEEAGLIVAGESFAALAFRRAENTNHLVFRDNGGEERLGEMPGGRIKLRVIVSDGGICVFSFAVENDFIHVPGTFQATAGVWIGAKVGLFALKPNPKNPAGHADFKYFRFLPKPQPV